MNAFRIIGVILISMLLLVSLVGLGTTETLQKSTKYSHIEYKFTKISKDLIKENLNIEAMIQESLPLMQSFCVNNTKKYSFEQNNYTFEISCDSINQGTDAIINEIINQIVTKFIENYYYKDYDCGFIECLNEQKPLVLISEKAHEYWTEKSRLMMFISLGLAVILFFLIKHKSNFFIISGGVTIGTSILISQLPDIASNIVSDIITPSIPIIRQLEVSSDIFSRIASTFFAQAESVYLWFLMIGIILVAIGILFKVFNLTGKIVGWIKKRKGENSQEKTNTAE